MRKPYNDKHTTFLESSLVSKEPIKQFKEWFDLASKTENIKEANSMCLATATKYYYLYTSDSCIIHFYFHR